MRKLVAFLVAAAASLAACGTSDTPETSAPPPPSDKKITVYSGRTEALIKPVLEQFTTATGVAVEVRYGDTAAMAAQLLEEGDRSPADLFLAQDAGALGEVTKKGMFAKLPTPVLDKVPSVYRARGGEWVGVTGRSRVFVYNSDQVTAAQLPKSVFEVTGPAWTGKLGVAPTNGSFQAFITAIRVQHGDSKAREFLSGLKANQAQIRPNNGQIVADVDSGKLAAGLVNHYYLYEKARTDGKSADTLKVRNHFFPDGDTGALVNVSGLGVLKRAENDPDVRTFIDYLLGPDGQKYFAEKTFEYPLVAGVTTASGLPQLASIKTPAIDLNNLDTLKETVAMIKESGLA
ncbi:MAG TPA: iron ABC transporter substrate-binding protein [Candidatus Limnocylindrales bacterium]